ncbi:Sec-independent protein translocase protein TatB [Bordetella sp. FB-8]|uniref:Sec-independent protein translocase protein TatB n=1 Tax=Bordetella sp. FB-8 TaxID=1159870 RepID=UPI00036F0C36|nr:Sec-independent protein translocase protein TatB [Bordetella sp. FB-8]
MFDFSFAELATIGVVALVVIGPERLPKVARTVGHLMGRAQRYVNDVKADIQREIELDEFRKLKQGMDEAAGELRNSLQETQNTIHSAGQTLQAQLDDAMAETKKRIVDPNAALAEQPVAEAAAPALAAPEAGAQETASAEPAPVPTQVHSAQAELPLAQTMPAVAAPPEPPAKPPVNPTTGTPT